MSHSGQTFVAAILFLLAFSLSCGEPNRSENVRAQDVSQIAVHDSAQESLSEVARTTPDHDQVAPRQDSVSHQLPREEAAAMLRKGLTLSDIFRDPVKLTVGRLVRFERKPTELMLLGRSLNDELLAHLQQLDYVGGLKYTEHWKESAERYEKAGKYPVMFFVPLTEKALGFVQEYDVPVPRPRANARPRMEDLRIAKYKRRSVSNESNSRTRTTSMGLDDRSHDADFNAVPALYPAKTVEIRLLEEPPSIVVTGITAPAQRAGRVLCEIDFTVSIRATELSAIIIANQPRDPVELIERLINDDPLIDPGEALAVLYDDGWRLESATTRLGILEFHLEEEGDREDWGV